MTGGNQATDKAGTAPCALPCPKCGGTDIHRRFRANGAKWRVADYSGYPSKYANGAAYSMIAWREHIDHDCMTCHYQWQTLPLPKARKPKPAPKWSPCETCPAPADCETNAFIRNSLTYCAATA